MRTYLGTVDRHARHGCLSARSGCGGAGPFAPKPQSTTVADIEVKGDRLALIPAVPRGAPPVPDVHDRRSIVEIRVPHFPIRDTIFADYAGSARLRRHACSRPSPAAVQQRIESCRFGSTARWNCMPAGGGRKAKSCWRSIAIPALPWPARKSTCSSISGSGRRPCATGRLSAPARMASGPPGTWRLTGLINDLGRDMADELPAGMMTSGIGAGAARLSLDAVSMHPERRAAYIGSPRRRRQHQCAAMYVQFRDIMIEEYRGRVGTTPFVADNMAYFVPLAIPDLFVEVYSPADYADTVNTEGLARYLRQEPMEFNKGMFLEGQMNVLRICTIPRALFSARVTPYSSIVSASRRPGGGRHGHAPVHDHRLPHGVRRHHVFGQWTRGGRADRRELPCRRPRRVDPRIDSRWCFTRRNPAPARGRNPRPGGIGCRRWVNCAICPAG